MAEVTFSLDNLKQTLEYLKIAVKNEREERKTIKSSLENLTEEVAKTEKFLKEKIHSIGILNLVIQDLDHKIRSMNSMEGQENSENRLDSRGLFILEQTNSKLIEDNTLTEAENKAMIEEISSLEQEIVLNSKALSSSDETLKQNIEDLKSGISNSKAKIEQNKSEKVDLVREIEKLKARSEKSDSLIREKNAAIVLLEEKHSKVKKEVESSKEYEKEIVDKLAKHINIESEMASELLKYRSTVAEARSSYQKFYIKRIWMLTTTNVTLILNKGIDGKHVLQTIDGKKTNSYKVSEVDAVFMHPTRPNRFFIRTCGEQDQEYESENAAKIMTLIRELVFSDFNGRE